MRKILWLMLGFLLVLSACAAPATPTPAIVPSEIPVTLTALTTSTLQITATPTPFFVLYSDKPIVSKGQPGTWDDRYTDPGAVLYHDGAFHMFRNGFRGFPAESQVGYVTSPDGYIWTKAGAEPVFKTSAVAYARVAMYASSALVMDDGTWVIYFYTWDTKNFPSESVIGRATASHPAGPWVADPEPVLKPGAKGEWDAQQVLAPHVIQITNGYVMYYSGANASGAQRIGMATSTHGVQWTKYNDHATSEAPYAESDPVLQPGDADAWDMGWVHQPRVFQTSNGWTMIYRGTKSANGNSMALGVATSTNGVQWTKSVNNPVFKPTEIPKSRQFWFDNAVFVNGIYYVFVEGDISQTTQIYLLTHQGEVLP